MTTERERQKLALQGGLKAVGKIEGKGKPKIGVEEFMAVANRFGLSASARRQIKSVLAKEDWGTGPFLANYYSGLKESCVQSFERSAREVFGVHHALGISSGTAALHSSFVAAGVGPGTEVICSAIGFFATAAAVVQAKGVPVFCDVDESLSIDPTKIEALITPRTVVIAPTHVMGSVCDMKAVMRVAAKHKLKVVEDCAQSCGAKQGGRYVGTFGDLGCFSISAYKIVGGGEGGLLLAKTKRLWERTSQVAECGGLWRPNRFGPARYAGELFCGTNYRMSEMEAAIDTVQLRKMDATVARFRTAKQRVLSRLKTFREITPQTLNSPDGEVGYNLRFYPETLELGARIVEALNAEGIGCDIRGNKAPANWHIYSEMFPVLLQSGGPLSHCPFNCAEYKARGGKISYNRGDCPVADDLFDRVISVGLNQWFSATDCRRIAEGINKVLSAYCTPDSGARAWM